MLKLLTYLPFFSFHNFRYLKLFDELAKKFKVYVFAGAPPRSSDVKKVVRYKLLHVVPFYLPGRIRQIYYPLYRTIMPLNIVGADVIWLIEKTGPPQLLLTKKPIILDLESPRVTLPNEELYRQPMLYLKNELRLLRSRKISKIVVTTQIIKKKLIMLGVKEEKISVIPYGVDTSLFFPTPLPSEPVILYYGAFPPFRTRLLIETVKHIARKRKDAKFILIGNIPSRIKVLLRSILGSNVEMYDLIEHDQLPQYLQRARVCILPQDRSLGGRLSFKLLEYMASGRPVVATNVDESFPLKESGAGLITEIEQESFADAVIRLLEDDALANHLAWKGVEYAQKYDWNKMVEDYIKLLQQVCNES
jgi:glycosyltransferase involved in cell wall biosynthesis